MCKECEWQLFSFGKRVLGKGAGGMINKLMQKVGIRSAWIGLEMAADKQDPREYIGAILRDRQKEQGPALSETEIERLFAAYKEKMAKTA